ncbi:MAG: cell wall-binding repeat-containing protein [Lachnospiraceae bacterium]|nr:cell wall-binding repeat-containing protein [Lachnospiraceae bacterium]
MKKLRKRLLALGLAVGLVATSVPVMAEPLVQPDDVAEEMGLEVVEEEEVLNEEEEHTVQETTEIRVYDTEYKSFINVSVTYEYEDDWVYDGYTDYIPTIVSAKDLKRDVEFSTLGIDLNDYITYTEVDMTAPPELYFSFSNVGTYKRWDSFACPISKNSFSACTMVLNKTTAVYDRNLSYYSDDFTAKVIFTKPDNTTIEMSRTKLELLNEKGEVITFAKDAGTYYLRASAGISDYFEGTCTAPFTITPKDITGMSLSVVGKYYWTGNKVSAVFKIPEISQQDIDEFNGPNLGFNVVYGNNVDPGTATITVTGQGNYMGTTTGTFDIIKTADMHVLTYDPIPDMIYSGGPLNPGLPQCYDNGEKLIQSDTTDYTIGINDLKNNVNVGTASIIIYYSKLENLYTAYFNIVAADINTAQTKTFPEKITLVEGEDPVVNPTIIYNGMTLVENTDFTKAVEVAENQLSVKVTLTGMGNYTGTLERTIPCTEPMTLSNCNITDIAAQTYTGAAIEPNPTVTYGETTLIKGIDYTVSYSNNTTVGTATATITGITAAGTRTVNFSIVAADIDTAETKEFPNVITLKDGEDPTVEPNIVFNGTTLTKDVDYTVAFTVAENKQTASVVVTGMGNFTGTITRTIDCREEMILAKCVIAPITDKTYTGSAIEPSLSITFNGTMLVKDVDYTVAYSNNTAVGTATAAITGITAAGTSTVNFSIVAANIDSAERKDFPALITLKDDEDPTVSPTIVFNGTTLVENTDYTVSVTVAEDKQTASVVVSGMGNFTGSITRTINCVEAMKLANCNIADIAAQTYTGAAIEPSLTITFGDVTLKKGTDYTVAFTDNTSVGTATATITGITAAGTRTVNFSIVAADIDTAQKKEFPTLITLVEGEDPTVAPNIVFNNATLTKGVDYTVEVTVAEDKKSASVVVSGMGNFTGSITRTITCKEEMTLAKCVIAPITDKTYTGAAIEPSLSITFDGVMLVKGTDYSVTYVNNTNVGTATAKLTGITAKGTRDVEFKIVAADISKATITAKDAAYTGSAIKPQLTVKFGDKTLVEDTDYTVSAENNTEAGTATFTVTGKGNFTGTYEGTFKITKESKYELLEGATRYSTAVAIAVEAFPEAPSEAILVTGAKFPDALSANAYAGALNAPIILSKLSALPTETQDLLKNKWGGKVKKVTIVGGGFSAQVLKDLKACGVTDIKEVSGTDRYKTAEAVCRDGWARGIYTKDACIIATGAKAADALSMSPWSYRYHIPILLAGKGKLRDTTKELVKQFKTVYIAGSEVCCETSEVTSLGITPIRLAGPNRYATSVRIAEYFMNEYPGGNGTIDGVAFAHGDDSHFPDALVGGMLQGQYGSPIILVKGTAAADEAYTYSTKLLKGQGGNTVYLLGAVKEKAIYDKIMKAIK